HSERDDPESHVRRILPMMTERRIRIIHCGKPMHERRRPERRFARITEIEISRKITREFLREAQRNLIKQIVRMLPVVERIAIPGLTSLKEQRVTPPSFGQQIEAHHSAKADLRVFPERMRIHRHKPVWR